eukprot:1168017-Prymnesium_polylepis.1
MRIEREEHHPVAEDGLGDRYGHDCQRREAEARPCYVEEQPIAPRRAHHVLLHDGPSQRKLRKILHSHLLHALADRAQLREKGEHGAVDERQRRARGTGRRRRPQHFREDLIHRVRHSVCVHATEGALRSRRRCCCRGRRGVCAHRPEKPLRPRWRAGKQRGGATCTCNVEPGIRHPVSPVGPRVLHRHD